MVRLPVVLVLSLVVFNAAYWPTEPGPRSITPLLEDGQEIELLASESGRSEGDRLVPLDPLTLADREDGKPVELDVPSWDAVLSADGSTLVRLDVERTTTNPQPARVGVTVIDFATGSQRAAYELPITVGGPAIHSARLSRDGSRLVLEATPGLVLGKTSQVGLPEWHVVETATGKVLAIVPSDPDGGWSTETWIDPDARRLYRLLVPLWPRNPGPGPAIIVAHDLSTGEEIGRLEVPEVRAGTWDTGRTYLDPHPDVNERYPVIAELRPGGALSPDGRRLALVHADADAVTLIDAERLAVERTVPFALRASLGDRLLSWLPLSPRKAAAKRTADGTRMGATFAADGRHLYIWGDHSESADDGSMTGGGLPLRLVDTARGDLVAETAADGFYGFEPSADGRSLYAFASGEDEPGGDDEPPMLLRRLDAVTLVVRAQRTFAGYPRILLRPAVPNGSDAYIV